MASETQVQIPDEILEEIRDFLTDTDPRLERVIITVTKNEKGVQVNTRDWNTKVITRRLARLSDGREIIAISILRLSENDSGGGELNIKDESGYIWFSAHIY